MAPPKFIVNKNTQEKYYLNDCVQLQPDQCDPVIQRYFNKHFAPKNGPLPARVDMRKQMTPIENQEQTKSCVANALAGISEFILKGKTKQEIDVSRLFIYYNARLREHGPYNMADKGCDIRMAVSSLKQDGTCMENIWPFRSDLLNARPYDQAYQRTRDYGVVWEPRNIPIELEAMRNALAKGYPFIFGLVMYSSAMNAPKGRVQMPGPSEGLAREHPLHAMVAVGYRDDQQVFIVRNSWGTRWGRKGYCYIPYAYMTNPNLCLTAWSITAIPIKNQYGGAPAGNAYGGSAPAPKGGSGKADDEADEEDYFDDEEDDLFEEEYEEDFEEGEDDDDGEEEGDNDEWEVEEYEEGYEEQYEEEEGGEGEEESYDHNN